MSVGGVGLERDGKVGVHLDGSTGGGVSRLEVIEGPTGRRRRTKAERARIAAESLVPGASVADVARRHDLTRQHIYQWRREMRRKGLWPEAEAAGPSFLPVEIATPPPETMTAPGAAVAEITVVLRNGRQLRCLGGIQDATLTRLVRLLETA